MTSDRIARRVSRLIDAADEAADRDDWEAVETNVARVLAIDPHHDDALALQRMARAAQPPEPSDRTAGVASAFVAPHLSDPVRRIREEVIGERRNVAVVFVDAVGFTSMSESLGEEAVYRITQTCLAAMTACIHRYDGTVTQFRGDGVMALFGAPLAMENSAVSAARAALEMRDELAALESHIAQEHGASCKFRIGINTGPVVVGSISDDLQMDFTAIGDTVNLAARVEALAEPGAVWLTERAAEAVVGFMITESRGEFDVKGKAGPVRAFELIAASGAMSRFEAALAHGLSAFVGRERELAILSTYVSGGQPNRPTVIRVVGEAGIGKSRIVMELRAGSDRRRRWVRGFCTPSGSSNPLESIGYLLRDWLEITDGMDEPEIRRRCAQTCEEWPLATRPFLSFAVGLEAPELADLEGRMMQAGIVDVMTQLLSAGDQGEVLLVVEDVHWIDESSAGVIRGLVQSSENGFTLMVTERPGYDHPLEDWAAADRVVLPPLAAELTGTLAATSLALDRLEPDVSAAIARRAGGNPLFIEELSKAWVEQGWLDASGRRAHGVDIANLPAPASLQEVILARIDRLDPVAKEALQIASVIGREFSARLLEHLAEVPDLARPLELLRTVELIRQVERSVELAFMFKHALTHEVAYSTLLIEHRKRLHRRAATAIAEVYEDRLYEFHAELARHLEAAEEWREAAPYLEMAARRAALAGAIETSIEYAERLEAIADRLDDLLLRMSAIEAKGIARMRSMATRGRSQGLVAGELFGELADLRERRGDVSGAVVATAVQSMGYVMGHDRERSDESSRRAASLARSSGDAETEVIADAHRAVYLGVDGDIDAAMHLHLSTVERFDAVSIPTQALLLSNRAMFGNWVGHYGDGLDAAQRLSDIMADPWAPWDAINNFMWTHVLCLAGAGRFEAALDLAAINRDSLERVLDIEYLSRLLNTVGWIHFEILDLEGAEVWNRRSIDTVQRLDVIDNEIQNNALLNLADIRLERADAAGARELLRPVEEVSRHPGPGDWFGQWRWEMHLRTCLAQLAMLEGDAETSLRYADDVIARAVRTQAAKRHVIGLRLRAEALSGLGRLNEAINVVRQGRDAARALGNPTQLWRMMLCGAELQRRAGEPDDSWTAAADAVLRDVASGLSPERRAPFMASPLVRSVFASSSEGGSTPSL